MAKSSKDLHENLDGRPINISKNSNFDRVFAILSRFPQITKTSEKQSFVAILLTGLKQIVNSVSKVLQKKPAASQVSSSQSNTNISAEERKQFAIFRNALKMHVYLFYWFVSIEEKRASSSSSSLSAPAPEVAKPAAKGVCFLILSFFFSTQL